MRYSRATIDCAIGLIAQGHSRELAARECGISMLAVAYHAETIEIHSVEVYRLYNGRGSPRGRQYVRKSRYHVGTGSAA
jgi:hypothetical protein